MPFGSKTLIEKVKKPHLFYKQPKPNDTKQFPKFRERENKPLLGALGGGNDVVGDGGFSLGRCQRRRSLEREGLEGGGAGLKIRVLVRGKTVIQLSLLLLLLLLVMVVVLLLLRLGRVGSEEELDLGPDEVRLVGEVVAELRLQLLNHAL